MLNPIKKFQSLNSTSEKGFELLQMLNIVCTYFHVPARWGLQQTTLASGSDKTRARDPLVC